MIDFILSDHNNGNEGNEKRDIIMSTGEIDRGRETKLGLQVN